MRKHVVSRKGFPTPRTVTMRAVEDISFRIHADEAFGLAGESGCGKSTAARALLHLIECDAGRVTWKGQDVPATRGRQFKTLRRRMQIVFQDPYSSLDPHQSIGSALVEPMRGHGIAEGVEARRHAGALLGEVGVTRARQPAAPLRADIARCVPGAGSVTP